MPYLIKKSKVLPYWLPSVGPRADPGIQAFSPQVTLSHPPNGKLSLHFTRPAVTFPAHRPVPNYTAWWQMHMRVSSLLRGAWAANRSRANESWLKFLKLWPIRPSPLVCELTMPERGSPYLWPWNDFNCTTSQYYCAKIPKSQRLVKKIPRLSLIHIWRCRRSYACRSRWSPYH